MKKITFFTLCLTLFLVGNLYSQQTVWVTALGAGTKDGSTQANAVDGMTKALVKIDSAGDVLRVVGTVPVGSQTLTKAFAYTIEGNAGGSTLTGVTAATRMFNINFASAGQNVTFKNITFSGQTSSIGGGGAVLFCNQPSVTINFENCRFNGNNITGAGGGGALFLANCTVNISDCLFKENQAVIANGGAIQIGTAATVTITRCTFYRNKTASTTATVGGAAFFVTGTAPVVTATNCTFFQNTVGHTDPEYGTIRTAGGTTTVNNSLFYDNKMNATWTAGNPVTTGGALADWGSGISTGVTLTKSLAQTIDADVTNTNSNVTANLASSNLTYDDTSGKVKFGVAPAADATPIGFGDSSTDVGAWNCGTRVTPTFDAVAAICSGTTLSLPTSSTNGVTGTWSPAIDNTTTTTYTFTPNADQCALRATMTITVTPSTTDGSVTVSQNTPYTWAKNSVTYTETTNISIVEGCNTATLNFTLLASTPPTITALTSDGTTAITEGCGGSTLIIKGADFSGATAVTVNGVAVAGFTVNSSTQITATLPAGPIATGVVTVTTPAGTGNSAGNFAVNAIVAPTFTAVAAICSGGSLSALPTTSDNGITGTWSPALNNTATTEYTFTPTAGQCATTATMTITVNACPADIFTWNGTSSNDWATAANWTKTAGTSPDGYPGQTPGRLIDTVVINNGGTPVVASGTYQIYSLAINNATGGDTGSILTINSGATLTVNNTGVNAITLNGGSIVNNGTLNATATNTGASFGIACLVPSVAPSTAKEYGYSGSGALNITTTLGNASSGGILFDGTSANTTYKMLFNGTTTFNLNNTALAVYALRVVDGVKNPVIIGGAGFTLGTVGAPVNYGLLVMGNNGSNVTVDAGTTLTLNSAATNAAIGINILQTNAASADVNFTNKGTIAILGASSNPGINLLINNSTNTLPAINKINFENQGTVNVDVAVGSSSNNAALRVQGAGTVTEVGLVTITNTGTGVLNLKNSQSFTAVTGCPIRIFGATNTPAVTINNAGALSFTGQNINFGGSAAKSSINNTGTIVSSSEFQYFAITNANAGTITFDYNSPATSRSVNFTVLSGAVANAGATYTDANSNVYTVVFNKTGTSLVARFGLTGGTPATGTLTKTSGTGDATIPYTSVSTPASANPLSANNTTFINNGTVNTGLNTNLNSFADITTTATSVISPGGTSKVGNTDIANATTVALNGTLKLEIQSITSSTSFDQITNSAVGGGFNISNATLDLTGIFTPVGNRTISILTTEATGTLTGNFASVIGLESNPKWSIKYTTGTAGKVELVYSTPTTWTGTTSTDWTIGTNWSGAGAPNSLSDVTIADVTNKPIIASNVSVNSLTLNASASLTVNSGFNLTVAGAVANNGGTMTIENNANLIQGGTTNTNTGNVIVKRNSNPLFILDYTMWSSPVSGTQTLAQFSPLTSIDPYIRFYTYNPLNNKYTYAEPTSPFTTGTGYLIRMPKEGVASYIDGTAPSTYSGQFTGIPNNGTITLSGLTANSFHSVGNPYPSTISADAFISGNSTTGTLYFWRKRNAQAGSAYATYNSLGGTASGNASSTEVPNGTIQVGQGFIVKTAAAATTLAFTNDMRTGNVSTQIFKTKQVQKDRVWVNLTRPATKTGTIDIPEAFSQTLIGYMDGATLGVDEGIDGKYINDSKVALTSNINNEEYTIQGRPKFDPADVVALNFKTDADGAYTIALDHFDGVFAAGQDVYLVDSKTGTETDLKAGAYTFNATTGVDNTRFSLKYQKTLKVDAPAFNENSVSVYKNNGALYVNSGIVAMSNIKVFDIQGRLVAEQKNLKSTTAVFNNLKAKNQVLIVKITGENNNVVSKKIVN